MIFKKGFLFFIISFIVVSLNSQSLESCKPNKYYKQLNGPGLLLGYHYSGNRYDIGVSKVFAYREKRAFTNVSIVRYKPPVLIEAALSSELAIVPKFYIGPQLSLWATPLSILKFNLTNFLGKTGFHTLGHMLLGSSIVYYMDFNAPTLNFRPELGLYTQLKIKRLWKRSFYLFPRLMYGYNMSGNAMKNYGISKHQVSFRMTTYWKLIGK